MDFGFSKKMVRSNTICGTSEHLASELFREDKYDKGEAKSYRRADYKCLIILRFMLKRN